VEKLLFLFPRKPGLSREEFVDHYLEVHAPLGLELTRTMVRYTVNLRGDDDHAPEGVDAFTETWTESVSDFLDPAKSFATPDDAQRLMTDHNSFIGSPYDVYAVDETVRKGVERPIPTGERPSGTRAIVAITDIAVLHRFASLLPEGDVVRYVENPVRDPIATEAFGPVRTFVAINLAPGSQLVSKIEEIVDGSGAVYLVHEYVQK
jgi:hypothetical protein